MDENKFLVEPVGDFTYLRYPDGLNPTYLMSAEESELLLSHHLKWLSVTEEQEVEDPVTHETTTIEKFKWTLIENDPTDEIEHNRILARIEELKQLLADSDYKAIKHSEGLISDEDYEPIKLQRQAWRDEINSYEN